MALFFGLSNKNGNNRAIPATAPTTIKSDIDLDAVAVCSSIDDSSFWPMSVFDPSRSLIVLRRHRRQTGFASAGRLRNFVSVWVVAELATAADEVISVSRQEGDRASRILLGRNWRFSRCCYRSCKAIVSAIFRIFTPVSKQVLSVWSGARKRSNKDTDNFLSR
jgi:hypothetical protein